MRRRLAVLAVAAATVPPVTVAALALAQGTAPGDVELVSRASGGAAANADSRQPAISADGRVVAFSSEARNLGAGSGENVFRRDLAAGATALTSRGRGANGAAGTGQSLRPAVSANAQRVAFQTDAQLGDGREETTDVYARDFATNQTILVSRASQDGPAADDDSGTPAISADGRYVAFRSDADNILPDTASPVPQIFVRDLETGVTTLVSRATGASGAIANEAAIEPDISGDGTKVAFRSFDGNLAAGSPGASSIYVRDLVAGTTERLVANDNDASEPDLSHDGRYVAFTSDATNLVAGVSGRQVYVRDRVAGRTAVVSRADGAGGAIGIGASDDPSVSANGRLVAFSTAADNLTDEDEVGVRDVFVRDLETQRTELLSRAPGATGAAGTSDSSGPALSADGRYVAFESEADNLSDADTANFDVFRRRIGAAVGGPGPGGGPGDIGGGGSSGGNAGGGNTGGGNTGGGENSGGRNGSEDRTPPVISFSVPARQKLRSALRATVGCPLEACTARISARVALRRKDPRPRRVRAVTRRIRRNTKVFVRLRLTVADRRRVRTALARRRPVLATLSVSALDAAGNRSVRRKQIRVVAR